LGMILCQIKYLTVLMSDHLHLNVHKKNSLEDEFYMIMSSHHNF
jgi:hypothetical protein